MLSTIKPRKTPTKSQVIGEAHRLERFYRKRRGSRPGRNPDQKTFYVLAAWKLFGKARWETIMEFLEANFKDEFGDHQYNREYLYRSKAYKEIIYENTWDSLRLGQKVYLKIKNEGPISPRKIQQDLNISRVTLSRLPRPGFVIQTTCKKPKGVSLRVPSEEEARLIAKSLRERENRAS
jgi:hypothetical protein